MSWFVEGPLRSRRMVSASAVIVRGGSGWRRRSRLRCRRSGCATGWSSSSRRWRAAAAAAAAGERAPVCARAGRAGWPEESAADAVSARGDAGPVRVGAAVSGRLALGAGAAGARAARSGWRRRSASCLGRRRHRDRQGRQALAGGEAAVLGHARQDRQLPDHGLGARGRRAGDAAARLAAVSAGGVVRRPAAAAEGEDPGRGRLQDEAAAGGDLCEQAAGWEMPPAPILADPAYGDDAGFRTGLHEAGARVRGRGAGGDERLRAGDDLRGARAQGSVGRPRTVARPDRKPESVRALAERLPAKAWQTLPCRTTPGGRGRPEPLRVRPRRRHQPGPQRAPAAALGVADHRMARGGGGARPTTGSPTSPRTSRASGSPGSPGCAGRSSSTTGSSKASSASTTTKAAATAASTTTPRSSPARTPSSPRNACARVPRGRPDAAAGGAAPAARPALLGRPLPHLPPARRPRPTHALPPTRVTKSY